MVYSNVYVFFLDNFVLCILVGRVVLLGYGWNYGLC